MILILFILLSSPFWSNAKVNLTSSAARVCPGDILVFTCITDTGVLLWGVNGTNENAVFYGLDQLNTTENIGNFSVNLITVTGMTLVSTATVRNVSTVDNGTIITCSDSDSIMKHAKKLEVNIADEFKVDLNFSIVDIQQMTATNKDGILVRWDYNIQYSEVDFKHYLITHNVSADQSPIATNRTNVTLYGVRPGETYMVTITCMRRTCTIYDDGYYMKVDTSPSTGNDNVSCGTSISFKESSSGISVGYIVSIASSVLLGIILLCYIVMCFCTSDYMMHNACGNTLETSANRCQDPSPLSDTIKFHEEGEKFQSDANPAVGLPAYDYIRHQ